MDANCILLHQNGEENPSLFIELLLSHLSAQKGTLESKSSAQGPCSAIQAVAILAPADSLTTPNRAAISTLNTVSYTFSARDHPGCKRLTVSLSP